MADPVRLKIDVAAGVLEIEAPMEAIDDLLIRVEAFIPHFSSARTARAVTGGAKQQAPAPPENREAPAPVEKPASSGDDGRPAPRTPRASRKPEAELRMLPDLNLRPEGKKSLREFHEEKEPKSNERAFAVIVYYLKKILGVEAVTTNHIYTALKDLGQKVPTRLPTVLSNSAGRHGWIDTKTKDDIKITIHGENFVEHDLPVKSAPKRAR